MLTGRSLISFSSRQILKGVRRSSQVNFLGERTRLLEVRAPRQLEVRMFSALAEKDVPKRVEIEGRSFKIAMVQLMVGPNKADNLARAVISIEEAHKNGAKMVVLPECFNSPYGINYFADYAEKIPGGVTYQAIVDVATRLKTYVIAGSIPELGEDGKLYNTCMIINSAGDMIGKHRKVHLFDIDVPGKIQFKESSVLSAGDTATIINTYYGKIGIGICYDIRFPEMAHVYRDAGCGLIVYPGAFNMVTGPAHWQKLITARALDNQCYVIAVSPARDETAGYVAYGHTMAVGPWGDLLVDADTKETIVYAEIDIERANGVRTSIPIALQRRPETYKVNGIGLPK